MKRRKDITYYSETYAGNQGNYDWSVKFDITNGHVGIIQLHNKPLGQDESLIERVLLTPHQVQELIKFVKQ